MRQFFITVAGVLTALIIAVFVVPVIIVAMVASSFAPAEEPLPDQMVVTLDLSTPIVQQRTPFFAFADTHTTLTLADLHAGLKRAAADDAVAALYIRGGDGFVNAATADEIVEALAPFRAAGKPVYGFAQDILETGLADYQVLAQAQTIWMQPTGSFMPAGLSGRLPYAKQALDEIGITADAVAFREYKGAMDIFTATQMSAPQREANQRMVDMIYANLATRIAEGRGFAAADLDAALEAAPFGAQQARTAGLVDDLAYERQVLDVVMEGLSDEADFVALADYAASRATATRDANAGVIAVIYGEGAIMPGESTPVSPFGGEATIGSDTMANAIMDASEDEDVKAILVRINSPGGSASASDQVWDAIRAAQAKDIPVIASMGSVAASGGYYIPAGADLIIANPTTVTGSIGVIGAKFSLGGLLEKIGVNVDAVSSNPNADIWASDIPFSDEQRQRFSAWLETAYEDFKQRVAEGRELSPAETESIAKGRIWVGMDARDKGLVDRLGGFSTSLAAARELAGLEVDAPVELRAFPKPKTFQEELFGLALNAEAAVRTLTLMSALADHPEVSALVREITARDSAQVQHRARVPVVQ